MWRAIEVIDGVVYIDWRSQERVDKVIIKVKEKKVTFVPQDEKKVLK